MLCLSILSRVTQEGHDRREALRARIPEGTQEEQQAAQLVIDAQVCLAVQ
jgi:hypothetical protein